MKNQINRYGTVIWNMYNSICATEPSVENRLESMQPLKRYTLWLNDTFINDSKNVLFINGPASANGPNFLFNL